jgi:hypothetical protein
MSSRNNDLIVKKADDMILKFFDILKGMGAAQQSNTMNKVSYKVINVDTAVTLPVVTREISSSIRDGKVTVAASFLQALGFALSHLWEFLNDNRQYAKISIEIGGIVLPERLVKVLKNPSEVSFNDPEKGFKALRNYVAGEMVMKDPELGVRFIRETDTNKVFKSVKDANIDIEMVAAQVKGATNLDKFRGKMKHLDAQASLWTKADLKAKSLFQKKQLLLKNK